MGAGAARMVVRRERERRRGVRRVVVRMVCWVGVVCLVWVWFGFGVCGLWCVCVCGLWEMDGGDWVVEDEW